MQDRKIRMGMVGGGEGAFIGNVHRMAANLDGQIELVCGAFSANPDKSQRSGRALFLQTERCYASYQEMFEKEQALPDEQKMDIVSIVTPNHLHFDVAKMALEHGFHVICDKPATFTLAEAKALKDIIATSGRLYGLTHTYNGYPLVKQAKQMVANGELGKVVKVVAQYSQGWLSASSDTDNKQAAWRLDPKQAGISCCMGDIGVHAANLMEYISGQHITELCSDLTPTVSGRQLDDDGTVIVKFNEGAKGVLTSSQISVGEENGLAINIYGENASLTWRQEEPNSLWLKYNDKPTQMIRTGVGEFCNEALAATRTPAGHPEGYLEAFANLYTRFAEQVRAYPNILKDKAPIPGIEEAIRGMAFIENAVKASDSDIKWHKFTI
ncbi:Gfo/Idh/MocA family protein [Glaciecola petra]|uniref:Gfo/Idh/MocA family oxidoreductase n=1 Tax=Glaciecola petra TaxID=3075602 RepID=A0ABU2ZYZ0_9ALTE|nr:Gfo/Idh/MocA family oxidoreductase [Aestuariibacter sp. P117]MDT0596647.1 Gfo/Idh/MocA family oxidoreductase [Aestuariibacter sp. P117]